MKHECGCPQVKLNTVAAFIPAVCFCVICCTLLYKWWLVCPVLYLPLVRNDSSFPWHFPEAFDRGLYVQQIPDNVLGLWLTWAFYALITEEQVIVSPCVSLGTCSLEHINPGFCMREKNRREVEFSSREASESSCRLQSVPAEWGQESLPSPCGASDVPCLRQLKRHEVSTLQTSWAQSLERTPEEWIQSTSGTTSHLGLHLLPQSRKRMFSTYKLGKLSSKAK